MMVENRVGLSGRWLVVRKVSSRICSERKNKLSSVVLCNYRKKNGKREREREGERGERGGDRKREREVERERGGERRETREEASNVRVQAVDPSLNNGRSCPLLEPQLPAVHHGAKVGKTASTHVLTTVLETCGMSHDRHMMQINSSCCTLYEEIRTT